MEKPPKDWVVQKVPWHLLFCLNNCMILSHSRKFIYLKTIKTGGSSVEAYFERYCTPRGEYNPDLIHDHQFSDRGIVISRYSTKLTKKLGWHTHMPASMLVEMLPTLDKKSRKAWEKYFKFTIVRNPYDRAVSWFYYNERHQNMDPDITIGDIQDKFEKYITASFMSDWNIYTLDNVPCMDYYIKYENLHEGMQDVCTHLKVKWNPKLMPMHLSGLRNTAINPADLFNGTTKQFVAELCHREIDYFGYDFPFTDT